jgi:hypothetical protein
VNIKKIVSFSLFLIILLPSITSVEADEQKNDLSTVVFNLKTIRSLEDIKIYTINNFKLTIMINNETFRSPSWEGLYYVNSPDWTISYEASNNLKYLEFKIELYSIESSVEYLCDLKGLLKDKISNENQVIFYYELNTGHWFGDDQLNDLSGYGRLNGCDDGSIYEFERDCELMFDIYQLDEDEDTIPRWAEENILQTDPLVSDLLTDYDSDGIPTAWEYKWGYNPKEYNDHENLDPDEDSINNYEEYLTTFLDSDPFRKDVFLEIDLMQESPDGDLSQFPHESSELIKNPFHRRNILFHFDLGISEGGDEIPYDDRTTQDEIIEIYDEYFLNNNPDSWKRGIFHYCIFVNNCIPRGFAFSGDVDPFWGYNPGTNSFIISIQLMQDLARKYPWRTLEYYYGSATMHEMGHNFGIRNGNPKGCDNFLGKKPWQLGFWRYGKYKSLMNYRYTYKIFDYSDGSHGYLDNNDWEQINLSYFEKI